MSNAEWLSKLAGWKSLAAALGAAGYVAWRLGNRVMNRADRRSDAGIDRESARETSPPRWPRWQSSTPEGDPRRNWPGLPSADTRRRDRPRCHERLFALWGVDWRVLHDKGRRVNTPEPWCPRCRGDLGLQALPSAGGPRTVLYCTSTACHYLVERALTPAELVGDAVAHIERELAREKGAAG
jgi:hypothetical protein